MGAEKREVGEKGERGREREIVMGGGGVNIIQVHIPEYHRIPQVHHQNRSYQQLPRTDSYSQSVWVRMKLVSYLPVNFYAMLTHLIQNLSSLNIDFFNKTRRAMFESGI